MSIHSCPICWEVGCGHSYQDVQDYWKECDGKKGKEKLNNKGIVYAPFVQSLREAEINIEMFADIDSQVDAEPFCPPVYEFEEDFKFIFESYMNEFDALAEDDIHDIISILHEVYYIGKREPKISPLLSKEDNNKFFTESMTRKLLTLREDKKFKLIQKLREPKQP